MPLHLTHFIRSSQKAPNTVQCLHVYMSSFPFHPVCCCCPCFISACTLATLAPPRSGSLLSLTVSFFVSILLPSLTTHPFCLPPPYVHTCTYVCVSICVFARMYARVRVCVLLKFLPRSLSLSLSLSLPPALSTAAQNARYHKHQPPHKQQLPQTM